MHGLCFLKDFVERGRKMRIETAINFGFLLIFQCSSIYCIFTYMDELCIYESGQICKVSLYVSKCKLMFMN